MRDFIISNWHRKDLADIGGESLYKIVNLPSFAFFGRVFLKGSQVDKIRDFQ